MLDPPPLPGFLGQITPDKRFKLYMQDDFSTLTAEGEFLKTYGDRWDAAGTTGEYLTTSKRGNYDPNLISVVDLPTGERVMQCRLLPRTSDKAKHRCAAPQIKVNGSGYNGTKGEFIQFRARVITPADDWHAANLGWPKVWPDSGETDIWESGPAAKDTVAANLHVQNGGRAGQGQVSFKTEQSVTEWFTIGFERNPGVYMAWYLNGERKRIVYQSELQSRTNPETKKAYGIPLDEFRHQLQLEDSERANPTQPAVVAYDWFSIHTLV